MLSTDELQKRWELANHVLKTIPDKNALNEPTEQIRCYVLKDKEYSDRGLVEREHLKTLFSYHTKECTERKISELLNSLYEQLHQITSLVIESDMIVVLFGGGRYTVLQDKLLSQDLNTIYYMT